MQQITIDLDRYKPTKKKACHLEFQQRALDIAKELKVTTGVVMRYIKKDRSKVDATYQYMHNKTFRNPTGYFIYLQNI